MRVGSIWVFVFSILGVACAEPLEQQQGPDLQGGAFAALRVSLAGAHDRGGQALMQVTVDRAQIVARQGPAALSGADPGLLLATFGGEYLPITLPIWPASDAPPIWRPVELRISKICPHAEPPRSWSRPPGWSPPADCAIPSGWTDRSGDGMYEYEVQYREGVGAWSPLCDPTWNRAVPVAGSFDAQGTHDSARAGRDLSLGCVDADIVKCMNWGYRPWVDQGHFNLHQACTRMARADYCAEGVAHTVEGTTIDFFDVLNINHPERGLPAEAAWAADGHALCLDRNRWRSLPLNGPCRSPGTLKDPRVDASAKYCEDLLMGNMGLNILARIPGAVLSNSSIYRDTGLFRWTDARTGDSFTSSRYVYEGIRGSTPPPGYDGTAVYEGAVYLPDLPESERTGMVPLVSYRGPTGEHITTTMDPPAGYEREAIEGYVYPPSVDPPRYSRAFFIWYNQKTGDYRTTNAYDWAETCCPGGACRPRDPHQPAVCDPMAPMTPPDGYTFLRKDGYLPRTLFTR